MNENFKWNDETHTYEIVKQSLVDVAKNNIDDLAKIKDMVIMNDADYKTMYKARTEINNAVKEVSDARKQMTAVVLSFFAPMCIEVEKYGASITGEMTRKLNEYKKVEKEVTYKLVVSSKDKKAIEKIKAIAISYGCDVKGE